MGTAREKLKERAGVRGDRKKKGLEDPRKRERESGRQRGRLRRKSGAAKREERIRRRARRNRQPSRHLAAADLHQEKLAYRKWFFFSLFQYLEASKHEFVRGVLCVF